MSKKIGNCAVCGKEYEICRTCSEIRDFKPWRTIVDTMEHYKIHIILSDYTNKRIDKNEAKELLKRCEISDYKNFLPHIVKAIDEILKVEKKTVKKAAESDISDEAENSKENVDSEQQ